MDMGQRLVSFWVFRNNPLESHPVTAHPDLFEQRAKDDGMARAAEGRESVYECLRNAMQMRIGVKMDAYGAVAAWVTSDDVRLIACILSVKSGNWMGSVWRDPRFVKVRRYPDYRSTTEGSHGNLLHRWTLREFAESVRAADARAA